MTEDSKDIIEQDLNKAINFLGQNKFSEAESVCNEILKAKDNSDAYHILSSMLSSSWAFDSRLVSMTTPIFNLSFSEL